MSKSTFVYVTYIRTTQEKLWSALTDPDFMTQYWFGCRCESDWKPGSAWTLRSSEGKVLDDGKIVEVDPPRRLVIHWQHRSKPEFNTEGPSRCTIELEPVGTAIKLSITHTSDHDRSKLIEAVSGGWPKIMSNLKSLMENGTIALQEAYPKCASE
jgi:uncharacterized protein YndB with AHSA1/START domain